MGKEKTNEEENQKVMIQNKNTTITKAFSIFVKTIHLENKNSSAFPKIGNITESSNKRNLKPTSESKSFPEGNMMSKPCLQESNTFYDLRDSR
jgi:hypothetical protein